MGAPGFWDDQETAAATSAEHAAVQRRLEGFRALERDVADLDELAEMASEDSELAAELDSQLGSIGSRLAELEEARLFSGQYDAGDAVVTVRSGAGGTDSQDWAEMLLRMYLRWAERRGFEVEMAEASPGEEAGIKSASFIAKGANAYGLFSAERGVHRLVRISPFDAQSRRHTAFAQVDVAPLVDDRVEVEIDDEDLRIDTYRASGAGGQHVNKTDSAVRITHCRPGSWSSARTSARRPRTRRPRCGCCARGCSSRRSASAPSSWRRSGASRRRPSGDPRSAPTPCTRRPGSRTTAPGSRSATPTASSTATSTGSCASTCCKPARRRLRLTMALEVAVGVSDDPDPAAAFGAAAAEVRAGLDGRCDLAVVFAGAPHLPEAESILPIVDERLRPASLIGCGAGGVLGAGRELESGPGAVVWGLSAPGSRIGTMHLRAEQAEDGIAVAGLPEPEELGEAMILLADPVHVQRRSPARVAEHRATRDAGARRARERRRRRLGGALSRWLGARRGRRRRHPRRASG